VVPERSLDLAYKPAIVTIYLPQSSLFNGGAKGISIGMGE
jgi:hypothetical protein